MGTKFIKDQVFTSTTADLHGFKISHEELTALFEKLPDSVMINQEHDLSKPPAGKASNFRLRTCSDGELQLIADIELFNDQIQIDARGLSISFTSSYDGQPKVEADVDLLINPLFLPHKVVEQTLGELVRNSNQRIQLLNFQQKSADEIAIMVVVFAGLWIAQGFFGEIGAGLYRTLKEGLIDLATLLKKTSQKDIEFHFQYKYVREQGDVKVIVVVTSTTMKTLQVQAIDLDNIQNTLNEVIGDSKVAKVVVQIKAEAPYWEIVQICDVDGKIITLS